MSTNLIQSRLNIANAILKQLRPALGGAALLDVGMTAGTVAAGDDPRFGSLPSIADSSRGVTVIVSTDPRLTDDRFPLPHHSTHWTGGDDAIDPLKITAVAAPPIGVLDIDSGSVIWDIDDTSNLTQVVTAL